MQKADFETRQQNQPNVPPYISSSTFPTDRYDRSINLSFCEMTQKYKPQSNSVGGGLLLLMISGLHITWGIWRLTFNELWVHRISRDTFIFTITSWYVTCILGSIAGSILVTIWTKKRLYYLSGFIFALSSILFIIWYDSFPAILCGRMLAGAGHGIVYVTVIIHAADNAVKQMRGMILSSVSYIIVLTMFIAALLLSLLDNLYILNVGEINRILGILGLIYAVIALLVTPFFTYESVPFLISNGNERQALENMIKLRNESTETIGIRNDLEEMTLMINEDKNSDKNIFNDGNLKPLLLVTASKLLYVLTNNLAINKIMMLLTYLLFSSNENTSGAVLTGMRFIFSICALFTTYSFGRKTHLSISGGLAGLTLLAIGILLPAIGLTRIPYWLPTVFFIVFQSFVAFGIDPIPHILISEAFAMSKTAWSITFATTIENLAQIILIAVFFNVTFTTQLAIYFIICATAICILLLTLLLYFGLPETRAMSLKQARNEFSKRKVDAVVYSGTSNNNNLQGITYA